MTGIILVGVAAYLAYGYIKGKPVAGRQPNVPSAADSGKKIVKPIIFPTGGKVPSTTDANAWIDTAKNFFNFGKEVVSTGKSSKQSPNTSPQTTQGDAWEQFGKAWRNE